MGAYPSRGRLLLVGLTVVALLAGCGSRPATVEKTADISYESSNPVLTPGVETPNPNLNLDRPLPDPEAADAFFAPRDPSGVLRTQLEANGALADGILDFGEAQELPRSVLDAQESPVWLDILPGSTHISLSDAPTGPCSPTACASRATPRRLAYRARSSARCARGGHWPLARVGAHD